MIDPSPIEYTIGDPGVEVCLPDLVSTDCPLEFTYTVEPLVGYPIVQPFDETGPCATIFFDQCNEFGGVVEPYALDYTVIITGTSADLGFSLDCEIEVELSNPCANLDTLDPTAQGNLMDNYSGITQYFSLTPFTITPASCESSVTYTCEGVLGPDGMTAFDSLCDAWVFPADSNGNLGLTASPGD